MYVTILPVGPGTKRRAGREPLTRERILRAALRLVDEQGLEALSMRRLGQELGVEAMSLYNHVSGKDDILDGIVDLVFSEIPIPEAADDWREWGRRVARSGWETLLAHANVVPVMLSRPALGPEALRVMDAVLGTLRRAGFDPELAHHAWHALASHVLGYVQQEVTDPLHEEGDGPAGPGAEELLQRIAGSGFPHVAEIAPYLAHCRYQEEFDFGLDILLEGLETKLRARRP